MSIVSSETIPDNVQADGTRRVRYSFTDHLGGVHGWGPHRIVTHVTTPFDGQINDVIYSEEAVDSLIWDGSIWQVFRTFVAEGLVVQDLKDAEINENIELLRLGIDVFVNSAEHQTDLELFNPVMREIAEKDIISLIEYHKAIPILNSLNNPKLTAYGFDFQAWNDWQSDANTLKVAVDNYNSLDPVV